MNTAVESAQLGDPLSNYSHGVSTTADGTRTVHVSGQIAYDGQDILFPDDVGAQTTHCYEQIDAILAAAGGSIADVVKTTTYVTDISRMREVAAARARFLREPFPASTAVEVSALLLPGLLVEVEAVAVFAVETGA